MLRLKLFVAGTSAVALLITLLVVYQDSGFSEIKSQEIRKSLVENRAGKTKFTFNDIFGSKFSYKSVNPRWVSDHMYIIQAANKDIILKCAMDQHEFLIMPGAIYTDKGARSYQVSASQNFVLLLTDYVKGWRHSYNGTYIVYDVNQDMIRDDITFPSDVQYITWSPVGDAVAYVYDFDIYYRADVNDTTTNDIRITDDGSANSVYNGIPDWVYEEEMISTNNVIYFSPDGGKLAYAQFNDTECSHIQFSRYDSKQYPEMIDVSYPKAGTTQPTNKVYVYDIASGSNNEAIPPTTLSSGDYLFSRAVWANESRVAVTWCNRLQTWSMMVMCDITADGSMTCPSVPQFEHKTTTGWLYQRRPYWIPVFGQSAEEYFVVLPNNKWQHLARADNTGNKEFLTEGEYTVTSYSASYPAVEFYKSANDYVYFLSTFDGTENRQVYRRKGRLLPTMSAAEPPECITCPLRTEYPERCNIATSSFSKGGSRVVIACRGEGAPLYIQFTVNHTATDPANVLIDKVLLEENLDLVDNIAATEMPVKSYGNIDSKTGYKFRYERLDPPNFDVNKKYPLLIEVYAGPGYQNVDAFWSRSWGSAYVPAGLGVILVRIDGRGSNFYGDEFMHEVYQGLGQKEIEDQIEAAEYFGKLPEVDSSKIAMWGWSYGGFATSHALGLNTGILKCGMAVAPLVDWRYYDTIYAERYMGLPAINTDGYDKANIINKAENFPQSSYYLIHGTADDNVHFQNSAQLSKALVENDIRFNNFFYADQDHSINVGNAYTHVYKVLTRQLCQCFNLQVPDDVWN
uniref:dipeptidyl peptidase 4 n=1 Tax=Ciona intestinalis TaxID=7719 RepID=UPI000180C23F|nr:dipeptidyl peptidase 4 [Ciona intestinalis]|eukprot:XP_002130673.1 dipeptidyl peptidase 4 [Ciona intestinalis]